MALGSRLGAVTAGGLSWLLCMQARRCVEQQREQTEERRESVQRFLHLYGWTFQSAKSMHSLRNFLSALKTEE